jgi:hypothetical protein
MRITFSRFGHSTLGNLAAAIRKIFKHLERGAERLRFATFGSARAGLGVPRKRIDVNPRLSIRDEAFEKKCGRHGTGLRAARVDDVADVALDHLVIRLPERHAPNGVLRRGGSGV